MGHFGFWNRKRKDVLGWIYHQRWAMQQRGLLLYRYPPIGRNPKRLPNLTEIARFYSPPCYKGGVGGGFYPKNCHFQTNWRVFAIFSCQVASNWHQEGANWHRGRANWHQGRANWHQGRANWHQGGAYWHQGGANWHQGGAYWHQGGAYWHQGGAYWHQGGAYWYHIIPNKNHFLILSIWLFLRSV